MSRSCVWRGVFAQSRCQSFRGSFYSRTHVLSWATCPPHRPGHGNLDADGPQLLLSFFKSFPSYFSSSCSGSVFSELSLFSKVLTDFKMNFLSLFYFFITFRSVIKHAASPLIWGPQLQFSEYLPGLLIVFAFFQVPFCLFRSVFLFSVF